VTVYADAEKLQQILLNLVTNAVKFTPAGGLVSVICETSADVVSIHVRDTGIGIPERDLERIFEPFGQGSESGAMGAQRGVGLGLAISRQLARLMGGDVTVVSRPGEGATFTLTLPRHAPAAGGEHGDA
jgi:signal transduction histidine kinase